ncbi:endonuclease/exonuclease/phosphatase family protein [Flammeovirga pacifica]|uniref:Endonuclease/exonuclease/phosphatase domain-containing protein n=1 Tax=Flammeovirga pacifica TaxID=915059 RepID=A0A1S1Z0G5_FLAPC|nr:endonuclease/exonuclease/phosphatase family protein [Flammeovirga pacifica]OHX66758.1 hypothetical protein NH26_10515 [Flammeovirga pacifica]
MIRFFGITLITLTIVGLLPSNILPIAFLISLGTPIYLILLFVLILVEIIQQKKHFKRFLLLYITVIICKSDCSLVPNIDLNKDKDLSVVSYNVSVFNVYAYLNHDFKESKELINWLRNDTTDIYCFQEYYNCDTLLEKSNPNQLFRVDHMILNDKKYHLYAPPFLTNHIKATFGLAIVSKYPIIDKGYIKFSKNKGDTNGIIWADVVNQKNDTLRIVNFHLQSLAIDNGNKTNLPFIEKGMNIVKKVYHSSLKREEQVAAINQLIKQTKYPYILCGDANTLPYSNAYFNLKKKAKDTHYSSNWGWSFTHRDFPLRIDYTLFQDKALENTGYEVLQNVDYSDHLPIKNYFRWKTK